MRRSDSPFLSIIIPMYNTENYIRATLESIRIQDFDDYQIIVVDDGSTDSSLAVAKEYAVKDERISVLHKENGGQSSARNLGMRYAGGEYILFVDSDDQLAPNVLGRMTEIVRGNELDILRGKLLVINGEHEEVDESVDFPNQLMTGREKLILGNISYSMCAYMYRRSFLEENRIQFIEGVFHEDMDFIVRAYVFAKKVMDIDVVFYYYYMREGSTTNSISTKKVFDYYKVAESVLDLTNSLNDSELYEAFLREYLAFLFSRVVNMCLENELPITDIMEDKERKENIIFCLKNSRKIKYRAQAVILRLRLFFIYSIVKASRGKGRGK